MRLEVKKENSKPLVLLLTSRKRKAKARTNSVENLEVAPQTPTPRNKASSQITSRAEEARHKSVQSQDLPGTGLESQIRNRKNENSNNKVNARTLLCVVMYKKKNRVKKSARLARKKKKRDNKSDPKEKTADGDSDDG